MSDDIKEWMRLTVEMNAASEADFEEIAEAKWQAEESILKSGSVDDMLFVLASRRDRGLDISDDLAAILSN